MLTNVKGYCEVIEYDKLTTNAFWDHPILLIYSWLIKRSLVFVVAELKEKSRL
jgi:hypothetical protein